MVDSTGGDHPPSPTEPTLDSAMLTMSVTSPHGPTVDSPSGLVVIQLDSSTLESSLVTLVVSDPIPVVSVFHDNPVPNVPLTHNGLIVGHVVTPTFGPDLPPLAVEDPVMEEYPFAESIINLLKSLANNVDEASNSTLKEQCISLLASLVLPVDQLEDGEIVRGPILSLETTRSLMVLSHPTPHQGIPSPSAPELLRTFEDYCNNGQGNLHLYEMKSWRRRWRIGKKQKHDQTAC
ncbi:hypothetical protein SUGI_0945360 [Cryptomeria japonica]|nr:hypothetical protein SUGI_0945360 [Cryptomeria japonica]